MNSGTVIALVVSFVLGIASTIAFIAWVAVGKENVQLKSSLASVNSELSSVTSDLVVEKRRLSDSKTALETEQRKLGNALRDLDSALDDIKNLEVTLTDQHARLTNEKTEAIDSQSKRHHLVIAAKDKAIENSKEETRRVEDRLTSVMRTPGVSAAIEQHENRAQREKNREQDDARMISYWIYKRPITTKSRAGNSYSTTETVVVFDTNRDGRRTHLEDEIWMSGRFMKKYSADGIKDFTLEKASKCLPERQKNIR
ncbi:MAG: hypothetical protein MK085_01910 [Phycisphaerales bacterium]|nr:hypothetical protein [Phycisphaerales bacterium]